MIRCVHIVVGVSGTDKDIPRRKVKYHGRGPERQRRSIDSPAWRDAARLRVEWSITCRQNNLGRKQKKEEGKNASDEMVH